MLHQILVGERSYGVVGPVMTGLGPSLRRLPSGDPKVSQNSGADGRPEGGSDAGDSGDSVPAGEHFHLALQIHCLHKTFEMNAVRLRHSFQCLVWGMMLHSAL